MLLPSPADQNLAETTVCAQICKIWPVFGNGQSRIAKIGVRLNKRAEAGAELRRLRVPIDAPKEIQLNLEDAMPAMIDEADTDVDDTAESQVPGATADVSQVAEADLGGSEGTTPAED